MVPEERINVPNTHQQVLRINGGDEENSYANNSLFQRKVFLRAKPILRESVVELYTQSFPECLKFADMGCSSGPNSLLPLWEIIEAIDETSHRLNKDPPMLQVFLNDLPGNDFNSIFKSLPSFQKKLEEERGRFRHCFVSATPGNFYGRLFPPHSLHLVLSSYSLHWLSEVPMFRVNKRQCYITKTTPAEVHEIYLGQFKKDFTTFLRSRSEEVITGGKIFLTFIGREENSFCSDTTNPSIWELFDMMFDEMISEGMIDESKVHSFNIPLYGPSTEEVKNIIKEEGSFKINKIELFHTGWDATIDDRQCKGLLTDKYTKGKFVAKFFRAVSEPIVEARFGRDKVDVIFGRLATIVGDHIETVMGFDSNVVALTKK